jgi:hypothetical protein
VLKYPVRAFLPLFLGAAFFLTMRLAVAEADFRWNPESAWRTPFWIRAANLARFDSSPDELRAALNLNPRLSLARIELGLNAEANSDLPEAEADLLQAFRFDGQYLPAWTLANSTSAAASRQNSGRGRGGQRRSPMTITVPYCAWPTLWIHPRGKSPRVWGALRPCFGPTWMC